jgi:hypothetical protein
VRGFFVTTWIRRINRVSSTFLQQRVRSVVSSEPVKWAALSCVCVAGAASLYFQDPSQSGGFLPPCPVYALTGTYCPGCGTARALHGLLHGDLIAALGYNPLLVVALPFIIAVLSSYALRWTRRRPLPSFVTSRAVGLVAIWVVGVYWVMRNIPLFPFTLLAP